MLWFPCQPLYRNEGSRNGLWLEVSMKLSIFTVFWLLEGFCPSPWVRIGRWFWVPTPYEYLWPDFLKQWAHSTAAVNDHIRDPTAQRFSSFKKSVDQNSDLQSQSKFAFTKYLGSLQCTIWICGPVLDDGKTFSLYKCSVRKWHLRKCVILALLKGRFFLQRQNGHCEFVKPKFWLILKL